MRRRRRPHASHHRSRSSSLFLFILSPNCDTANHIHVQYHLAALPPEDALQASFSTLLARTKTTRNSGFIGFWRRLTHLEREKNVLSLHRDKFIHVSGAVSPRTPPPHPPQNLTAEVHANKALHRFLQQTYTTSFAEFHLFRQHSKYQYFLSKSDRLRTSIDFAHRSTNQPEKKNWGCSTGIGT